MKHTKNMEYIKNVVKIEIDNDKCIGCGTCIDVCPRDVIRMEGELAVLAAKDRCIECGACSVNCPNQGIRTQAGVGCARAIWNSVLPGRPKGCC